MAHFPLAFSSWKLSRRVAITVSVKNSTNAARKEITPDRKLATAQLCPRKSMVSPRNSKTMVTPIKKPHSVSNPMQALAKRPRVRS